MALLIQWFNRGVTKQTEWHYGEPLPSMQARVVSFQADGDELELILHALKATRPVQTITAEVVEQPRLEKTNENSGS